MNTQHRTGPATGAPPQLLRRPTDPFAVAAFVTALVGGSLLSVVLGALALHRTRGGSAGGRGLAIAGVVLGALEVLAGLVVAVVVVVTGVGISLAAQSPAQSPAAPAPAATAPSTEPLQPAEPAAPAPVPQERLIDDLVPGDCYDERADSLDTGTVVTADCAVPHSGEVVAVHSVAGTFHDFFPGDEALQAEADARCSEAVAAAAEAAGLDAPGLKYSYYHPTEANWEAGSRLVQCNVVSSTGSLGGSLSAGDLRSW